MGQQFLFDYANLGLAIDEGVAESHRAVWGQLGRAGTWWSAEEMVAMAAQARSAFAQRNQPPWLRDRPNTGVMLDDAAAAAIDRIATNPSSVDRAWAQATIAELGDGPYVELVAVAATIAMIDMFSEAAGAGLEPLPVVSVGSDGSGEPTRVRPEGLGEIGAYVLMLEPFAYANVARALSLVPSANQLFRTASVPMYSAPGMSDPVWNTALKRPQVELVASRVAALNECFY